MGVVFVHCSKLEPSENVMERIGCSCRRGFTRKRMKSSILDLCIPCSYMGKQLIFHYAEILQEKNTVHEAGLIDLAINSFNKDINKGII